MKLLAALVLGVHLTFILWVIFGALVTRGRPWLTGFHLASTVWGIIAEVGPWSCPLTTLEQRFEAAAGAPSYTGDCLVHYFDSIVYPNAPVGLLIGCAIAVCGANLVIYLIRMVRALRRRSETAPISRD